MFIKSLSMFKVVGKSRYLLLVILIFLIKNNCNSQWVKNINLPESFNNTIFLEVQFLKDDPKTSLNESLYGWVCGFKGSVLRTTDGGNTWLGVKIPYTNQLEYIQFLNTKLGYCIDVTSGTLFKSIDGGILWSKILITANPDDSSEYVDKYLQGFPNKVENHVLWAGYFIDENNGIVLGGTECEIYGESYFYKTTDGGKSWMRISRDIRYSTKLSDGIMVDYNTYYAVSSGFIWYSDNGIDWDILMDTKGQDWHEELAFSNGSFLIPVSEGCHGTAGEGTSVGDGGIRFWDTKTKKWNIYNLPKQPMFGSFLHDEKTGWAVGYNEGVFYTQDAGLTWELRNCGIHPGVDLDDIFFLNDSTGWVVGEGIYQYKPVVDHNPEILVKDTLCYNEIDYAILDRPYNYVEWYVNNIQTKRKTDNNYPAVLMDSISVTANDSIKVYVEDWNMPFCGWINVRVIKEFPPIDVKIIPNKDTHLCFGDSITLKCQHSGDSLLWSNGITDSIITVNKEGKYSVTAWNRKGCSGIEEIEIFYAPKMNYKINQSQSDVCIGDSIIFTIDGDQTNAEWYLIDSSGLETLFVKSDTAIVKETTKIYAKLIDKYGCVYFSEVFSPTIRLDSNRFEYFFSSSSNEENFGNQKYPDLICGKIRIHNNTKDIQILKSAFLYENILFSIPPGQLPKSISPSGFFELDICYNPKVISPYRDTLIINDNCKNHIIPLLAQTKVGKYDGGSKCDVIIEGITQDIATNYIPVIEQPYPNPTNGKIIINVMAQKDIIKTLSFQLYNILGNAMNGLTHETFEIKGGSQNELFLDVPTGKYFLKVSLTNKTEFFIINMIR